MKQTLAALMLVFFLLMWWKISRTQQTTKRIALLGALIATVAAPFLFAIAAAVVTLKFIELMWREITDPTT